MLTQYATTHVGAPGTSPRHNLLFARGKSLPLFSLATHRGSFARENAPSQISEGVVMHLGLHRLQRSVRRLGHASRELQAMASLFYPIDTSLEERALL
jgi:hypothetical protein